MKWFRHFHNASSSIKIQQLIDDCGVEGYGQYFLLLELLTEKFDGNSTEIELHFEEISAKIRIKFSKKLELFVQKLANFSLLSYQISGKVYKINCPILLELQDKDSKYNRKRIVTESLDANNRIKNKNKNKNKEVVVVRETPTANLETFNIPENILQTVKINLGYPENIIYQVANEAWLIYLTQDPSNRNWSRFLAHYFKNESGKIRDRLIASAKGYDEEIEAQKLRDKYASEE